MTFDEFHQSAWADHSEDAEGVAARLDSGLALAKGPSDLAVFARLVVHVLGGHLGRWADGRALLGRVKNHPAGRADTAVQSAVRVALATLDHAEGRTPAPSALRGDEPIRALAAASSIALDREDLDRASALFVAASDRSGSDKALANSVHRPLAVAANNLACALEERDERTDEQTALMVRAARAARVHWGAAGGWLETERAEYVLARALLAADDAAGAAEHAEACAAICAANDAPDFEWFYVEEIRTLIGRAVGDDAAATAALARARERHAAMDEAGRAQVEPSLAALGQ